MSTMPLTHEEIVSELRAMKSIVLKLDDLIAISDAMDRELDRIRGTTSPAAGQILMALHATLLSHDAPAQTAA